MPKYNLNIGGRKLTVAQTDEKISSTIGRKLGNGKPQTLVDSGGSGISSYTFSEQAHDRQSLKEIKEIREDGGVIATLVHSKALMTFGGGFEVDAEEEIQQWVEDNLPRLKE